MAAVICLPLLWTVFVAGTSNRGALVTAAVGIVVVAMLGRRSRNWLPFLAATAVLLAAVTLQGVLAQPADASPSHNPEQTLIPASHPGTSPTDRPIASPLGPSAALPTERPLDSAVGATSTERPEDGDQLHVANAGFELGPVNNGTIERWTPGRAGSYNIVRGGGYRSGNFASIENLREPYQATLTSSRVPFTFGSDISVSVWVKGVAGRPILEIYVNWYDRHGTLISSDFLGARATYGVRMWQKCAGAITAPKNTAQAQIVFYEASGKATIGIDEVMVRSGDFVPEPVPPKGRPATLRQLIDNILSLFGSSSDLNLEGTKQFRLAWWGKIVDYTVFGRYFWTGKGFGVNLADADGFQSTVDHSLRSPHNTEITVLARMGVPGLLLWLVLQGAFGIGLLVATLAHRRRRDWKIAAVGALLLAYWAAMMVDTSFDPYLEGPQGGIWFWVIFGLGLVVMRIAPRGREAA